MSNYKYRNEILNLKEEILNLHNQRKSTIQQISNGVDNYHSFTEEDELLHQELTYYISQAKTDELEFSDEEEIEEILKEAEDSHRSLGEEILTIISQI